MVRAHRVDLRVRDRDARHGALVASVQRVGLRLLLSVAEAEDGQLTGVVADRGDQEATARLDPSGVYNSQEKREMWQRAHDKTLHLMFKQGIVRVA